MRLRSRELQLYLNPKVIGILCLGICSGLPLALVFSTLSVWLSEANVSRTNIGLFALVSTPYAFKFLWSPLVDQLPIPFFGRYLGRRRAWLLLTQCLLIVSVIALGFSQPESAPFYTALFAFLVALFSATQDIIIDAYRVEILNKNEQGAGAAMVVFGYRIGMLISGAGVLSLAHLYGWQLAYIVMAVLLPLALIVVMILGEPLVAQQPIENAKAETLERLKAWCTRAIIEPFSNIMQRQGWLMILLFIVLYKLGDAFAGVMTNPFLVELGFTKIELAKVVKTFGFAATIVGAIVGGVLVDKIGIVRSLWLCGILQILSNLIFLVQYWVGHDLTMLAITIGVENLAGGMGTTAFVAFISMLCNRHYTATQYALLSSLASVGRTFLSASSGATVDFIGWEGFFIISCLIALPGLILLHFMRNSYLTEHYIEKAGTAEK